MGVQEMDAMEMRNIDGGLPFLIALGLFGVGAAVGFFGRYKEWW